MSITCLYCGKTGILGGTIRCPSCGRVLPKASPTAIVSSSASPVLVDTRGRRYKLYPNATSIVGSRGCAVLLSDPGVPAQAARLTPSGGGFMIEDLCGSVEVNGARPSAPIALNPGDKVKVGSATLVYQGPVSVSTFTPPTPKPIVVIPPLAPILSSPPGITLVNWGSDPPTLEGHVELMDGPHRVEKGSMGAKVATSLALSMVSSSLAMIPFWMKSDVTVWFLRLKENPSGRMVSVIMRGDPGGLPQMGDFIAVWGLAKDGNIIMKRGFNYITNSWIRLKG